MTRILIVETAYPKRICHKVKQILEAATYPEPEIVILCQASTRRAFSGLSGVEICTMASGERPRIPKELNRKNIDIVFAFWTGEKKYRWMKLLTLRIKARKTYIIAGDGNEFRLTWKAVCRHTAFRMKHPLPTDHFDYAIPHAPKGMIWKEGSCEENLYDTGERVLIMQSAEPVFVLKALERLESNSPFHNPRYTLFCRNHPEAVRIFQEHPMLDQVLIHTEARESRKHFQNLRRQRFDSIVLFMTGDPSYRKIKVFAFLLGIPLRRMLVFNETIDCFFFSWRQWLGLVSRRMRERRNAGIGNRHIHYAYTPIASITKMVLLPFRFLWLLLAWIRLRLSGMKSSRKNHDYPLQLPPFSGT